ncbi:cap-gly domain-containing protein [Ophiostoma piceae UAMH 11346]|uniref:Cap-gly domain-containing protein n=1 Tax=Ophiostoma piceae (strain UAMH 11346) TaxID=1262450 RepID=S3BRA1_OPHP1|nr:cap-gly domain-containing protein [Ophiostoma piceae UAMH 11346]
MELAAGQIVQLADGRRGIIRFAGQTQFAPGDWIGVELETTTGKNDGSVQGERYFDCPLGHGMFLRPAAMTVIGVVEEDDDDAAEPEEEAAPPPRQAQRTSMTAPRASVGASGAAARRPTVGSRPSSVYTGTTAGSRTSVSGDSGLTKRMSLNAPSPSPVPRSRPTSIARSPTKSPTKQLGTGPSSTATSRTGTPSNAAPTSRAVSSTVRPRPSVGGSRTSMGPPAVPASRTARQSLSGAVAGRPTSSTPRLGAGRPSMGKAVGSARTGARPAGLRAASGDSGNESAGSSRVTSARTARGSIDGRIMSPQKSSDDEMQPKSPVQSRTAALEKLTSTAPKATAASSASRQAAGNSASASARPAASNAAAQREIEDLKAKLRVLERKRLEDRDKLKQLDKLQTDCDKYQGIIQKIQAKYQPLQQENTDLRKQFKEAEVLLESVETMQSEHDSAMELATLDREMAEETSEVYKAELDAVKLKNEELELEVEILRSENAEFTQGMTNEEKTSAGWLQMERSNERLREALLRLRDITQQQEEELRDEVKALQEDVKDLTAIKELHESAKAKLSQAEAVVEDLRQQLDAAQAADDMIMDLTERNMSQAEQVDELKAVIEDLENLRDINDELEINHVQNERELQEEIDFKAAVIQEQARRSAQQEESLEDMEYALSRFREMVTGLQTDLEDMRASHAVTENESEQLNSKTRAMMDLNLKLQLSAAKAQVKTIDLELRRMEAQEAEQHLEIVKLFMPDVYLQTDRNSVLALLRFRRLAFKANLLNGFVRERINQPAHPGHEDDVFAGCDVADKLTWVSAMCDRFAGAISRCSTEQFARFDGALYELEPVERALNVWIDGLRRDELKEKTCAAELQRSIALMSHLAEVHITPDVSGQKNSGANNMNVHNPSSVSVGNDDENDGQDLESFADNLHMRAVLVQSHLESAAIALHTARAMVQRIVPPSDDEDEAAQHFARRTELAISQTRSTKVVAGKAVRALEELKSRSLSLMPDTLEAFERCESASQVLSELARSVGFDLHGLLHTEGRSEPYTYSEVQTAVRNSTLAISRTTITSAIAVDADEDLFAAYMGKLRTVANQVSDLAALSSDISQTLEFERVTPPWVIRGHEIKAPKAVSVDAEEELRRLREEHTEARRLIARRDNDLGTAQLKIETLESKMRDAQSKASVIAELEQSVAAEKTVAKQLKEDIEKQDRELKTLESERDRWKKAADEAEELEGDGSEEEDNTEESSSDDDRVRLSRKKAMSRQAKERAVESSETTALLRKEIYCLQAIVRYLREDNRRARITEQASQAWLASRC